MTVNEARESTVERIWALLPRTYRARDEQLGGVKRQLVELIATEIDVCEESLDQFFDDLFAETAAEWALPYIGDLIGYRPLQGPPNVSAPRAEVANTIGYRRRKGTAAMLEQLAADVLDRPARAVEFFELLAATQYMNHPRPGKGATADLRHPLRCENVGTAFDDFAHLADVRPITAGAARHNIPNVGLFVWRLQALSVGPAPLVADGASRRRFRFNPLGIDAQLFGQARSEEEISHIAERLDVPAPLTRRWLAAHLHDYFGHHGPVAGLVVDDVAPPMITQVRICDLSDVPGDWAHKPALGGGVLAIDPVLGRVYFPRAVPAGHTPTARFHYGDALAIGGGGYPREPADPADPADPVITVADGGDVQVPLDQVRGGGAVDITDSSRYQQNPSIQSDPGRAMVLRAVTGRRPHLELTEPITVTPGADGTVTLDGLLISGGSLVLEADPDQRPRTLVLRDCTLVPGLSRAAGNVAAHPDTPSLVVAHPFSAVTIERCVLGPIMAVPGVTVSIADSVIDASSTTASAYYGSPTDTTAAAAALTLQECTVIGQVHTVQVDEISNSILLGAVTAQRRQRGCLRFSYLPDESRTPPTYRCQPGGSAVRPEFTSLRFGDPGYAQLRAGTVDAVRRGADNDSEMGAGNRLYGPVRESNLRVRLEEYLRFGLQAGVFYAT